MLQQVGEIYLVSYTMNTKTGSGHSCISASARRAVHPSTEGLTPRHYRPCLPDDQPQSAKIIQEGWSFAKLLACALEIPR